MFKKSSTRFNARLYTSHSFKGAGVVSDSLTGIHNDTVKSLFVVNRSCVHKGVQVFPTGKHPKQQTNKLHGLSPRANYTDRATVASRRSGCQLSRIKGATWSL
jgi:hypothetical protein